VKRTRFLRPAEIEVEDATAYFDEQRAGLGDRFEHDLFATAKFVTEHPFAGTSVGKLARKYPFRTFSYNLIYVVDEEELVIVAVAHHKRRLGYWRHRLASLN
jgi:plasmid stabilization system protein ParE